MKRILFIFTLMAILLIANYKNSDLYSGESSTEGIVFRFKDNLNDKYFIKGTSELKFFRENILQTDVTTEWESEQNAVLKTEKGIKFTYSYLSKKGDSVLTRGQGDFIRKINGEMVVDENSFYPQSINTPVFINEPVSVFDSWTAPCEEIIDFRKIGISNPFRLKSNTQYTYLRNETINGEQCAVIRAFYIVNENTGNRIMATQNTMQRSLIPARLIGYFERIFYWNLEKGFWQKMDADINFVLTFTNGISVEWLSKVKAEMKKQ